MPRNTAHLCLPAAPLRPRPRERARASFAHGFRVAGERDWSAGMIRSEMPARQTARWAWLRAPVFADEAKTHEAFLLNVIVWSMVLVPPPYVLFTLLDTPQFSGRALVQGAFGEAINLALLVLLRKGAIRLASMLQVLALFTFMT